MDQPSERPGLAGNGEPGNPREGRRAPLADNPVSAPLKTGCGWRITSRTTSGFTEEESRGRPCPEWI